MMIRRYTGQGRSLECVAVELMIDEGCRSWKEGQQRGWGESMRGNSVGEE